MVLHSLALTVKLVVHGPGKLAALGAVEPTLDGSADGGGASLLRRALSQTKDVALREHGVDTESRRCLIAAVQGRSEREKGKWDYVGGPPFRLTKV